MRKTIGLIWILLLSLTAYAQTKNNVNPRFALSAGIGTSLIENQDLIRPFKTNQLSYSLNAKLKINLSKYSRHSKSWLYYSNSLMWINNPEAKLSQWISQMPQPPASNLIVHHKIGIIFRRWLLLEAGNYNELGRSYKKFTAAGGFIIPFKNHSIELKCNYYFNQNIQTYTIVPCIQFNIDPKQ